VNYNTIYHNTWGIECYHSEEGSAQTGGTAFVQNTVFSENTQEEILTQSSSSLTISWSISDGDALTGNHNISGDPKLADPEHNDFSLQESSPCIGAGSPGPGGIPTTMGAWGGIEGAVTALASLESVIHILAYPNPTTGKVTIKSSVDGISGETELYNSRGILLFHKTISENPFLLDLSSYPAGLFLLRISSSSRSGFVSVVKE
jgi:hypothetical protein